MNDLEAMIDLGNRFGQLSDRGIGELFAGVTDQLLQETFERRVDPYGSQWAENRVVPNPFDKRNHIRNSFQTYYDGNKIIVASTHVATWYQHFGTSRGVASKPMVPMEVRGLGSWETRYQQAWESYMSRFFSDDRVSSNVYLRI